MGLTVLDAGVVIAVLDGGDAHHASAVESIGVARGRGDTLVLPVSAYAECLVTPTRSGSAAVAVVDQFLDSLPIRVEAATRAIGATAAGLRARHGPTLRLPDALVVATAIMLAADRVVTTDGRWPAVGVAVEVLGTGD